MKTLAKTLICTVALSLSTLVTVFAAPAAENIANETPSTLIESRSARHLGQFIRKHDRNLVKSEAWATFVEITQLYHTDATALLKLDPCTQKRFENAQAEIAARLQTIGGEEAAAWQRNVDVTANTIRFLWEFDVNSILPTESVAAEVI